MSILIFKSLHIIGFVAWFAGLFYLVRMFVYHVEAYDKEQPEQDILKKQMNLMEWRVYKIICTPALVLTWAFGIAMLIANPGYLLMGWLQVKLVLLAVLTAYHFYCKVMIQRLERGEIPLTSFQFRLFNEVPTLFLVAISFIAVLGKAGALNYGYLVLGIFGFTFLLFLGARAYKRYRASRAKK